MDVSCKSCGKNQGHCIYQFVYCRECGEREQEKTPVKTGIRRRGLTEHEALKLEWYKSDSKWADNIRSRRIVEKNGQKLTVYRAANGAERVLPSQPTPYVKNGGRVVK